MRIVRITTNVQTVERGRNTSDQKLEELEISLQVGKADRNNQKERKLVLVSRKKY